MYFSTPVSSSIYAGFLCILSTAWLLTSSTLNKTWRTTFRLLSIGIVSIRQGALRLITKSILLFPSVSCKGILILLPLRCWFSTLKRYSGSITRSDPNKFYFFLLSFVFLELFDCLSNDLIMDLCLVSCFKHFNLMNFTKKVWVKNLSLIPCHIMFGNIKWGLQAIYKADESWAWDCVIIRCFRLLIRWFLIFIFSLETNFHKIFFNLII